MGIYLSPILLDVILVTGTAGPGNLNPRLPGYKKCSHSTKVISKSDILLSQQLCEWPGVYHYFTNPGELKQWFMKDFEKFVFALQLGRQASLMGCLMCLCQVDTCSMLKHWTHTLNLYFFSKLSLLQSPFYKVCITDLCDVFRTLCAHTCDATHKEFFCFFFFLTQQRKE